MKSCIIVSDVRAVPMVVALRLARTGGSSADRMLASARTLRARDYGPNLYPSFYSYLKLRYLQLFHRLSLVRAVPGTPLTHREQRGIDSSLCSITCDSNATKARYPKLYETLEQLAKGAVEVTEVLKRERPDVVYVFNGRNASQYPIVEFCRRSGIGLRFYEYAGRQGGFNLFDFPPHYGYKVGQLMLERFARIDPHDPATQIAADKFRVAKLRGRYTSSFKSRPAETHEVVVFLSSDFEYTNLDEELCGVQTVGNLGLCRAVFAKYGGTHRIAVRAHPNQRQDASADEVLEPVKQFCDAHGMTYYDPESDVSSYALVERAEIVAVDCSTIGVDALLLGKNVDVFGQNDLAAILDSLPPEKRSDVAYLQKFIPQVMPLADEVAFVAFTRSERIVVRALTQLDRVFYHLHRLARAAASRLRGASRSHQCSPEPNTLQRAVADLPNETSRDGVIFDVSR